MPTTTVVHTVAELTAATQNGEITHIEVSSPLEQIPTLRLSPGQTLTAAAGAKVTLTFVQDADGLQLSSDNTVESLYLVVSPDRRAVYTDTTVSAWGTVALRGLRTVGQVQLLAREQVRSGHVEIADLDIIAADTRSAVDRPRGYGVAVLQGALTVWNMQPDPSVVITANLERISVGRAGAPVLGGGIFAGGAGDGGGRLQVQRLIANAVFSNGMIAPGTPDVISGGVFTVFGCSAQLVRNLGPVTTYGANDMALDNWGAVDRWFALEAITTYGASGIGFVNFGVLGHLWLEAPIETFGQGARGFNVYTGTVDLAEFDRIATHGDGAVGVQIAQPIGELIVHRGIETFGTSGPSLVKGVVQHLSATALSIKEGGSVERVHITGGLRTHHPEALPLELLGSLKALTVKGGITSSRGV